MDATDTALGVVLLAVAVAALGATGALAAAALRPVGPLAFLLTVLAAAWAALVAVVLLLSPFRLVTRWGLLVGAGATLGVAALGWLRAGRPAAPSLRSIPVQVRRALRDPVLLTLAGLAGVGIAYVVALAFTTPPLDYDALLYHLPRAALWRQQRSVDYVEGASDARLDASPPGGEIGILATMLLYGDDRFAALPQLAALGSTCLAIAGIARRIGLEPPAALFGALLFATLPLPAVQATTAYTDLVVAGFLVVAVYASLRATRADLALLALALALALTAKLTAVLALPVLALIAAVAHPVRLWARVAGAGAAGVALAAPWYLLNLIRTGDLDGGLADETGQRQELTLLAVAPTLRRLVYGFVDFSGYRELDETAVLGVAAIVAAALALLATRGRGRRTALVVAAVVLAPLALVRAGELALRAWYKGWTLVGRADIALADDSWELQTAADPGLSWYGPVAAVLLVAGTVLVVVAVRSGRLPRVAVVLSLSPLLFAVLLALAIPWDPWRGRFLAWTVALAAATWGLALARRGLAWGVVALCALTLPLVLLGMYTKPAGLPWDEPTKGQRPSVWTTPDALLTDLVRPDDPVLAAARTAVRRASGGTIALAPPLGEVVYPFFDPEGRWDVRLVPIDGGRVPDDARVVAVGPGSRVVACGAWSSRQVKGWIVAARSDEARAPCTRLG